MSRPQPENRNAYNYFCDITTRWMDNDPYAHVNNVVYYSWFDTAVNGYLIEQDVLDIQSGDVIGLVVETSCQYFSSIAFPDRVCAGVRVSKLGRSSVRYEVGIFREDQIAASAQGYFVHVYVDRKSQKPVTIPDNIRNALSKIQA
ncbi:MAG: thioesterase family protein [Gammaproteobacteria bacterium]|jgi:acyl-CoA thioester hydrolase